MKVKNIGIILIVVVFCIVMAAVDGIFKADYAIKSGVKIILFMLLLLYGAINRNLKLKSLFVPDQKGIKLAICLCIPVYVIILGGYLLLKDVFDFSAVTETLTENIGVHRDNFVFVSLYISFVNSLLEEFFFRGFAFLTLKKTSSRKFAYIFSAFAFAVYHLAMMIGWFSAEVFVIILLGLFAGGLIFNYLDEKSGTIYPSWLVHMFANFAINTIGFMLFGIIPGN